MEESRVMIDVRKEKGVILKKRFHRLFRIRNNTTTNYTWLFQFQFIIVHAILFRHSLFFSLFQFFFSYYYNKKKEGKIIIQ